MREADGQQLLKAEFAIGNRDLEVPSVEEMAQKVLRYFSEPHMAVSFETEAKGLWQAYATCFNSEAGVLRDMGDPGCARSGTAPSQLAVLAVAHMVWELATDQALCVKYVVVLKI